MYGALESRTHSIQNIENDPLTDPEAEMCFMNCVNAYFYNKDQKARGDRLQNNIKRINTFYKLILSKTVKDCLQ